MTFAAGASIATVTIDPTSDTTIEADETVVLTVTSGSGYIIGTDNTATATILNDDFPAVNVTVSPASVLENGATNLSYTFTRAGITNGTLTVSFSVSGTATLTTDYAQSGAATFKSTSGTVSFALGQTTKTVTINPVADTTIEADDTVILTVTPTANYSTGAANSATGTILNDDFPKITVVVSPVSVTENGSTNSVFTFTRPGPTTSALTVSFSVGGTATFNSDYTVNGATTFTASSGTVTFAAGQATKTVTVNPTGETTVEVNETVALTITSANGYLIGTRTPVIATITNDDTAAIRLASAAIVAEQVPLPAKRDTAAIPSNWMRVFEANLNALLTALP